MTRFAQKGLLVICIASLMLGFLLQTAFPASAEGNGADRILYCNQMLSEECLDLLRAVPEVLEAELLFCEEQDGIWLYTEPQNITGISLPESGAEPAEREQLSAYPGSVLLIQLREDAEDACMDVLLSIAQEAAEQAHHAHRLKLEDEMYQLRVYLNVAWLVFSAPDMQTGPQEKLWEAYDQLMALEDTYQEGIRRIHDLPNPVVEWVFSTAAGAVQ